MVRVPVSHSSERELEEAADRLLRAAPADPERPAYTERRLSRRARLTASIELLAATAAPPCRSLRDELAFLLTVSEIDQDSRRCLRLWIDGWTQAEIAAAIGISQQRISQRIRVGLRACYDASPISFERFSHHTIYRAPSHSPARSHRRRCLRCAEVLDPDRMRGRLCQDCRAAAALHRSARQRTGPA